MIALFRFVAKLIGHAIAGLTEHFVFTTGWWDRCSNQSAQCDTDRTKSQGLFLQQLVESATCPVCTTAKPGGCLTTGVACSSARTAQRLGNALTHMAGLFFHAGTLLLDASGFGGQLVTHRRAIRTSVVTRRGDVGVRLAILPSHHPDQADRGKHGRHRIGLYRIAKVTEELATAAFDVAQCGINQLTGRQLVLKRMNNVADLGTGLIDLTL